MTDKTLDTQGLNGYCAWRKSNCPLLKEAFEKGKQAGRNECKKSHDGVIKLADEIITGEGGLASCDEEISEKNVRLEEKIAALGNSMGFIEEGRIRTEQFNNELKKKNARLQEALERIAKPKRGGSYDLVSYGGGKGSALAKKALEEARE